MLRLAGGISGTVTAPVTDPEVTVDGIITISAMATLGTGVLSVLSGGAPLVQNTLPVKGLARFCLFNPSCLPGDFLPLKLGEHSTASSTIGLGAGGLSTIGGVTSPLRISLLANPWTLGVASALDQTENGAIFTRTRQGFVHGPASLTSSTSAGSGIVQLVTPLQITTTFTSQSYQLFSLFGTLRVRFLPEPETPILLALGALGMLHAARSRRARRSRKR